jgi:feS assembly protein sufB
MDMSEAVKKYPELVRKYFTRAIDENLHKYTALHLAVWSRRIICICAERSTFRNTNTIILQIKCCRSRTI